MSNYIDFSMYSSKDIRNMLREKQKEYIILIQSEKIAKAILSEYNERFYANVTEYHYRINKEYFSLYECAIKKQAVTNDELKAVNVLVPLSSIVTRLEENYNIIGDSSKRELYNQIIERIKTYFADMDLTYKDGYLYLINGDEEIMFDNDSLDKLFKENAFVKTK